MISIKYKPSINKTIYEHETLMFDKCQNIFSKYQSSFNEKGYVLKYYVNWHNTLENTSSDFRLPLRNGYVCEIFFGVERNGEIVCYDNEEKSMLGATFSVTYVHKFFKDLKVSIFFDTKELVQEIETFLRIINNL